MAVAVEVLDSAPPTGRHARVDDRVDTAQPTADTELASPREIDPTETVREEAAPTVKPRKPGPGRLRRLGRGDRADRDDRTDGDERAGRPERIEQRERPTPPAEAPAGGLDFIDDALYGEPGAGPDAEPVSEPEHHADSHDDGDVATDVTTQITPVVDPVRDAPVPEADTAQIPPVTESPLPVGDRPKRAPQAGPAPAPPTGAEPAVDAEPAVEALATVDAQPTVDAEPAIDAQSTVDAEPAIDAEPAAGSGVDAAAASRTSEPPAASDLALLRSDPGVRARVIAAVIVPFVLYLAALAIIGRLETRTALIWIWIPLVSAGLIGGLILDLAYRRRSAPSPSPDSQVGVSE